MRRQTSRDACQLLTLAALMAVFGSDTAFSQTQLGGLQFHNRHRSTAGPVSPVYNASIHSTQGDPPKLPGTATPIASKKEHRSDCEAVAQQHWDYINRFVRPNEPWNVPEAIDHMIDDVLECMFDSAAADYAGRYGNLFVPGVLGVVPQVFSSEAPSRMTSSWGRPWGTAFGR